MKCIDCQELMVAYVEGALEAPSYAECEQHLQTCADCRREHEAVAGLQARLLTGGQAAAAVSVVNRVMHRIREAQAPVQARRPAFGILFRWAVGLAGAAALVLVLTLLLGPSSSPAKAAEVMARGVRAVQHLAGVHLVCQVRTRPADNFQQLDPRHEFVPVELWKEFADPFRWRVEKPGRVAVMDGQSTVMFMRPNNAALKVPQAARAAFDTGWLLALADIEDTLAAELRMAQAKGWSMGLVRENDASGTPNAIVSVEAKSGLPEGDYLKNAFFGTADTRRVYRFDDQSGRLLALQVYMHTPGGDVLVMEVERIEYNPAIDPTVFQLALPDDVAWMRLPGAEPADPKYAGMTADQVARVFFEACGREDWQEVAQFWRLPLNDRLKQYFGGLKLIRLGEPFTSAASPAKFVPYEIQLRDGTVKKLNLSLKQQKNGRWYIDGGL